MAETTILAEARYDGFAYNSNYGAYYYGFSGLIFTLVEGQEYKIVWDGEEHNRTAFAFTYSDGSACIAVGNPIAAGGEDNGDRFCISCDVTYGYTHFFSTEAKTSHDVAIYQVVEEEEPETPPEEPEEPETPDEPVEPEEPEGIVLKDRNGNDVTYYGIETVTFDTTTEGKQQVYTKGTAVENLEIMPDFSDGDMPVKAADNTLVKSATIKKPETQVPENIRNGVNIGGVNGNFIGDTEEITVDLNMADGDQIIVPTAPGKVISKVTVKKPETMVEDYIAENVDIGGVIGALVAGGGKITKIELPYTEITSGIATIQHDLGVIPDIIFFDINSSMQSSIMAALGMSSSLKTVLNTYNCGYVRYRGTSTTTTLSMVHTAMDVATSGIQIHSVTDKHFKIGTASIGLSNQFTYNFYLIQGLT